MDASSEEAKYKIIAENSTDVIYTVGLDEKFTYISPSVKGLFGYDPQELIGTKIADVLTPESYKKQKEGMQKALVARRFEQPEILVLQAIKKDGGKVFVEAHARFMLGENGIPQGILGVARDVTDRVKVEEELKKRVEELEKVNNLMVNRELRMAELKNENEKLKEKLEKAGV